MSKFDALDRALAPKKPIVPEQWMSWEEWHYRAVHRFFDKRFRRKQPADFEDRLAAYLERERRFSISK